MRLWPVLVFVGIAAVLLVRETDAAQKDTIRVSTRLVQVNVVVRDKNGPIRDLRASDFTLLDNKKAQKIEVFSVLESRAVPKQAAPPEARIVSNLLDSAGEVPATATAILFDIMNTPEEFQNNAVNQLVSYLRTIRKEDRVALYILSQQLYVVQDFTGDPGRLAEIAEKIRASEVAGVELRTAGQLISMLQPPSFTIGSSSSVWVVVPMAYAMVDASAINQAIATSDALEAIARHLKGVPGRKNLVWLSAGFPFAPPSRARRPGDARGAAAPETPDNFSSQLNRASRALNEANVAIYPVDVRGLSGGYPEVMLRLADATGGTVAYYTNNLEGAVRTAVADGEISYTLGFYSTADPSDKTLHDLTVRLNRKNVEVRHRAGYYPSDNRILTARERELVLGELLGSTLSSSELGLVANAAKDPTIPGNYRITISVDAHNIRFELQNNRHTAKLMLATRLESSREKNVKSTTIPLSVSEDQLTGLLKTGLPLTSTLPGMPGDRLRIVVQDAATGITGALWLPLSDQ